MALEIVDPNSTDIEHLASVDVRFSGAHIGGGIYFSANHNPTPGGSRTAIAQRSLVGESELHSTTEYDYTLPSSGDPWDAYRDDLDNDGTLDFVKAGFDMSLQVGDRLASTGEFYDGPAVPLLIANDPNDLFGTLTITGYPSAANSLDGNSGTLHQTTGTLSLTNSIYTGEPAYTEQIVNGDVGGYFTIDDAEAVGGMSGGGNFLDFDADGDGVLETYLIGSSARSVTFTDLLGNPVGTAVQSTSFSPHYVELAAALESLTGTEARTADDFPRMALLSAQTLGSSLTTVQGQFFHEDIYGGVNNDTLLGAGGDDALFGRGGSDSLDGGAGLDTLDGGDGDDTLSGGIGADFFAGSGLGGGAIDVITDFEANLDVIDLSTYFATLDDVVAATVETGSDILISLPASGGGGAVQVFNTSIADLSAIDVNVICFTAGTLIETRTGPKEVQLLEPGDLVLTEGDFYDPVKAVRIREIGHQELLSRPRLWPIELSAGCLGKHVPVRTLRVSPQHRILVDSPISYRMTGGPALVSAKKLLPVAGVSQPEPQTGCTYVHLIFERHRVIFAEGCWSESLLHGAQALASLPKHVQTQLEKRNMASAKSAMPIVERKRAVRLVERHIKNGKPFQRRRESPTRILDRKLG
jgi:Ca2+-binding RTX toxin-like protein